jgi:HEAT repeat protein
MELNDFPEVATPDLLDRALALSEGAEPDSEERWAAVSALWDRPERSVFERALEWCASTDAVRRRLGANVLGRLGERVRPFSVESTPVVVNLLHDESTEVVIAALYALGHLRAGPTPDIAAFAQHASSDVRFATVHALGGRDEPGALDALRLLTADEDSDVRDWATFGLGTLCESDSPEIRDALAARLMDDDDIRREAIVGLAKRHDPRATAAIAGELARDKVWMLAIEAAELMPSPQFVPRLRALMRSAPDDDTLRALQRCEAIMDPPVA